MPRLNHKTISLLAVILLSFTILYAFYGNLFGKLNKVCFASGGDGMQSYINMEYHIKYDSTYLRCNSMNYPYGEHVFFTNNQPLISNTIKFISNNIADISGYTLGILNFFMLFALLIAPVFIFLIFTDTGVGNVIAIPASLAIAYMSPQIDRFGGHFNLSYVCAIPLIIWLLMRFFKKPSWILSVFITLSMLAGAITHFYFYGFFALIVVFFYAANLKNEDKVFKNRMLLLLHLFLQLILPFLILQTFYLYDHVTDRPEYPWGFFVYRAYPQSTILPMNRPYGQFLHRFIQTDYIDWEGYAFVGMTAAIGFFIFLAKSIQHLIKKQYIQILKVSSSKPLNILFWASLTGLFYSYGLPFILGLQDLVDYIGPVRQMRGIGRFSWVFFYVMNIVTVYWLWDWWKNPGKKLVKASVILAAMLMLCTDAWYNVRGRGKWLENEIPALTDKNLSEPENQWIRRNDLTRYQAIIPLPYFHIGSENIWMDGGCDIVNESYIAIKNSGLPCMGVMLSRTSLSQTVANISLMLNPSCGSVDMSGFPSKKPFLLLAARCDMLHEHDRELIRHARRVDSSGVFDLYELPFTAFNSIADSIGRSANEELHNLKLFNHNGILSTDSASTFKLNRFDSLSNITAYMGTGCYQGKAKNRNVIFEGSVPLVDTALHYSLSFWLNHVKTDLYPTTSLSLTETDPNGTVVFHKSIQVFRLFETINNNWALVKMDFKLKSKVDKLLVTIQNKTLRNNPVQIDNLMIKRQNTTIFQIENQKILRNNEFFFFSTP
jgi:hypothetical protein